jgi:GNAT superfamily N-acetyltransferase
MSMAIRRAVPTDAAVCGPILYNAFKTLADYHRFAPDFPSEKVATEVFSFLAGHPKFWGVVAEDNGRIVGSNFVDLRSPIAGIGPITVDPHAQNSGVGRQLMLAVMNEASGRNSPGIRLVQAAYHNRSLCLYTKLGFRTREPLSIIQGPPVGMSFTGYEVRPATSNDVAACGNLCRAVHGIERNVEFQEAIDQGNAAVVEHLGRITGYTTGVGFFGHSVAMTNRDLIALIGVSPSFSGPGFLLPTRNHEVFDWCLTHGLRLVIQATLMTIGLYQEPQGAWMPSILY